MGVVIIDGSTVRSFVEDEAEFTRSVNECFNTLDLNGDGILSRSELRKAFESMKLIETHYGISPSPSTPEQLTAFYDNIFDQFDYDHSGAIDRNEFRLEIKKILLAVADGLGECPIQMVLDDADGNFLQQAVNLEAAKMAQPNGSA
uniref:EF-hand domain-containing protein n=1 Tax=Opuntia streptacantha TaxID=393608 RepID=A0A7C9DAH1_OPUST